MLGSENTITADKLMIPKSAAMSAKWGNDNQRYWGLLTASAIQLAANKLNHGDFKTLSELLDFMANWRKTIGVILDHDPAVGERRGTAGMTPISDHPESPYRDQAPEFAAQFLQLQELAKTNPTVVTDGAAVTLTGTLERNQETVTYDRTRVRQSGSNNFQLHHTGGEGATANWQKAKEAFAALSNNSTLTDEEKKVLLKQILFYIADAMPFSRGAAAISQMVYHALEKNFLGTYTYFGNTKSAHGTERGLQYDIMAMLSIDFETFDRTFTDTILDPSIKVIDLSTKDLLGSEAPADKTQLIEKMALLNDDLMHYKKSLKTNMGIGKLRGERVSRLVQALTFMTESLSSIPENDGENIALIQAYVKTLLAKVAKDLVFYPAFYSGNISKQHWPVPETSEMSVSEQIKDRDKALEAFRKSVLSMHEFFYAIQDLYDTYEAKGNIPHYKSHYDCKDIMWGCGEYKTKGPSGADPLEHLMGPLLFFGKRNEQKFNTASGEFFDILSKFKILKNKNATQEAVAECCDEIVKFYTEGKYAKGQNVHNPWYRKRLKEIVLPELYANLDTVEENMRESLLFWQVICPKMPSPANIFPSEKRPAAKTSQYSSASPSVEKSAEEQPTEEKSMDKKTRLEL